MKVKLYLDTSIPSFLYADDAPEKQAITVEFWKFVGLGIFELFISDVVLLEINRCENELRKKLETHLQNIDFQIIEIDENIRALSEKYVQEGIIPQKYFDDALHLAAATYAEVDSVVSWNFRHMVKLSTIRGVNGVNKMLGLKEIEILTPQSWIEDKS
jgi:hypothetical protein